MLGRKAILQFFSDNLSNLLGFFSTILIARFLGAGFLGTIGYITSLFSILSIFSDLGFTQAHIKRVSQGSDIDVKNGTFLLIRLIFGTVFSVVVITYVLLAEVFNFWGQKNNEEIFIFILFFFSFLFNNLSQLGLATLQGLQKTAVYSLTLILSKVVKLSSVIVVCLFSLGTIWTSFTFTLESSALLIFSTLFFLRESKVHINTRYFKSYFTYALPLAGISILSYIIGNADKILIKNFWDIKEVGLYFSAQTFMAFPQSISNSLMTLFFPKISELYEKKDFESIKKHIEEALKYLSIVILPLLITIIIYSDKILTLLFGGEFTNASGILVILSLTVLIISLVRPYSNFLYAAEKGKYMFVLSFVSLITLIITDLMFIPKSLFGIPLFGLKGEGAALGVFNMWLVNGILTFILSQRLVKIPFPKVVQKIFFVSLITAALMYILKSSKVFPQNYLGAGLEILISLILYLILLSIFKIISNSDRKYFRQIIGLHGMLSYIKQEIKNE